MSARDKTLDKMRNNPRDWRINDLLAIAGHYGVEVRHDGGSHTIFSHPSVEGILSIPAHRPIKPIYVRQFLSLIDAIKGIPS